MYYKKLKTTLEASLSYLPMSLSHHQTFLFSQIKVRKTSQTTITNNH